MGEEVPEGVRKKEEEVEELWDITVPYYNAFRILSMTRQWAAGFAPLPQPLMFSDILAVATEFGYGLHFEEFLELMLDADRTWRDCWQADYKERNPPPVK